MPSDGPQILRPVPRRPFGVNLTAAMPPDDPSTPNTECESTNPNFLDAKSAARGGADTPSSFSRTRSILNLTSSTLFGIYSPTGYSTEREDPSTPWGTGAETLRGFDGSRPALVGRTRRSLSRGWKGTPHVLSTPLPALILNLAFRSVLLFLIGMGYGILVTHLHNDQKLAPFQVEGIIKPSYDWNYLTFWGVSGVGLGSLLPWIDTLWEGSARSPWLGSKKERLGTAENEEAVGTALRLAADWNSVVRSIGAFVGIAFAIRKLSWASTLQVSLTLALVNPVLWYIIDRSKSGLILSTLVAFCGTAALLSLNPEMMPSPASSAASTTSHHNTSAIQGGSESSGLMGGLVSKDTVECGTWIISVLFCSCVCFGNVGRRLALSGDRGARPETRRGGFI